MSPSLQTTLFTDLDYSKYLGRFPIHQYFDIDLSEYGDPAQKISYPLNDSIDPSANVELDDLIRLHYLITTRRVTTVLEFGAGKSSIAIADALYDNHSLHSEYVGDSLRRNNSFELHSIDSSAIWLSKASSSLPEHLVPHAHFHLCEVFVSEFNGRMCTYYNDLPNICPDLIYLDGPDLFSPTASVRGLTTAHKDRMPMAADVLTIEHFLTPGTLIVVDGRAANARFLRCNLQRHWSYNYLEELDQHFFELLEPPLGLYNQMQIEYCLGQKFFDRLHESLVTNVPCN